MSDLLAAHSDAEIISGATTAYYMAEGHDALRVARDECQVRRDPARGVRVRLADAEGAVIAIYLAKWQARRMRFSPALATPTPGFPQPKVPPVQP